MASQHGQCPVRSVSGSCIVSRRPIRPLGTAVRQSTSQSVFVSVKEMLSRNGFPLVASRTTFSWGRFVHELRSGSCRFSLFVLHADSLFRFFQLFGSASGRSAVCLQMPVQDQLCFRPVRENKPESLTVEHRIQPVNETVMIRTEDHLIAGIHVHCPDKITDVVCLGNVCIIFISNCRTAYLAAIVVQLFQIITNQPVHLPELADTVTVSKSAVFLFFLKDCLKQTFQLSPDQGAVLISSAAIVSRMYVYRIRSCRQPDTPSGLSEWGYAFGSRLLNLFLTLDIGVAVMENLPQHFRYFGILIHTKSSRSTCGNKNN